MWRQVTMVAKFLDDNNRAEVKLFAIFLKKYLNSKNNGPIVLLKTIFKYIETISWRIFQRMARISGESRPSGKRGARSSRPWDKEVGGGGRYPTFFSALRASVWSENKGGRTPRAPSLDPPLRMVKSEYWVTYR